MKKYFEIFQRISFLADIFT